MELRQSIQGKSLLPYWLVIGPQKQKLFFPTNIVTQITSEDPLDPINSRTPAIISEVTPRSLAILLL
jgi:hypothetical protein